MFENFSKTDIAKRTFLFDSCRCFCAGLIEAGFNAFALLIAIRVFHASKLTKSMLTSAWFIGYFIAPFTQILASRSSKFRTTDLCKYYMIAVAISTCMAIVSNTFYGFLFFIMLGMIFFKQPAPLMSDVYGQNYSSKERGGRLSLVLMILPISTLLFSPIGGKLMDISLQNYRWILLIVVIAAICSAISFSNIPSRVLPEKTNKSIFANFKIVITDKLFGTMIIWWTFSSIANQMTKPLRTEYLVNPSYGINASNFFETLACITIPFGCRILSSCAWGSLFDRTKIINVKVIVNCFMMLGLLLFFNSHSHGIISFASMLIGIAYSGNEVIWCLWVTKIAPKDQFSAYMSVNVAIAGLRGFLSPFIGYSLSHYFTLNQISILASLLILTSTLGLISLRSHKRFTMESE